MTRRPQRRRDSPLYPTIHDSQHLSSSRIIPADRGAMFDTRQQEWRPTERRRTSAANNLLSCVVRRTYPNSPKGASSAGVLQQKEPLPPPTQAVASRTVVRYKVQLTFQKYAISQLN